MFIFDVETLGTESNAVVLSWACIYFDPDDKDLDHEKLFQLAHFDKISVEDQVKNYSRKIEKDTVQWWSKQCENVKRKSLIPSSADKSLADAYQSLKDYVQSKGDTSCWIWARGNMDQCILSSVEKSLGLSDSMLPHYRWRDIRTAVDFLYGTTSGYVKTETPPWVAEFNPDIHITKHNPIDDCVFDVMQLKYGVK